LSLMVDVSAGKLAWASVCTGQLHSSRAAINAMNDAAGARDRRRVMGAMRSMVWPLGLPLKHGAQGGRKVSRRVCARRARCGAIRRGRRQGVEEADLLRRDA